MSEEPLAYNMGWETANIHFGSPKAVAAVRRGPAHRKGRWLHKAAKAMQRVTLDDGKPWRRKWTRSQGCSLASRFDGYLRRQR